MINAIFSKLRVASGLCEGIHSAYEEYLVRSIKEGLDLSPYIFTDLMKLLFGIVDMECSFVEWAITRMIRCSTREVLESYQVLLHSYNPSLIQTFDLDELIPELCKNFALTSIYPNPAEVIELRRFNGKNYYMLVQQGMKQVYLLDIEDNKVQEVVKYL